MTQRMPAVIVPGLPPLVATAGLLLGLFDAAPAQDQKHVFSGGPRPRTEPFS
jgi:hypothetical protein